MFLTRLRCIKLNKNYGKTVRSPIQFTTHSRSLGFLKKIDKNTEKSTTEKLKLPEDQSTDNTLKNNSFKTVKFSKLFSLTKPVKIPLATAIAFMGCSTYVTMQIPKRIGTVIDHCLDPNFYTQIEPLCKETAGLIIFGGIANLFRLYLQAQASEGIQKNLRNKSFENLIVQNPEYFDKHRLSSPEIVSRLASDSNFVGDGLTEQTVNSIRSVIQDSFLRILDLGGQHVENLKQVLLPSWLLIFLWLVTVISGQFRVKTVIQGIF